VTEVTEADCEAFDGYVVKWQKLLNLSDWRIERSSRRAKKSMAEISFNAPARLASYRVGLNFGCEVTPEMLEATALHELLHVLLFDLLVCEPAALEGVEHRVINVVEKLLLKGNHD